jgi:Na+-transporting NADH:ubiquinone oxidoreductase subunit C
MPRKGALYTIIFAGIICLVCSVAVSTAAVALKPRQEFNQLYYQRLNVLEAAGLKKPGESIERTRALKLFEERIRPVVIELATGEPTDQDPDAFDMAAALEDPQTSQAAPPNPAQVQRIPKFAKIYEVLDEAGQVEMVVLPIHGKGLWSTMYGFLAVDADGNTVRGITFYQHGETPGLGGEIENPRWRALWPGRKIYDEKGEPALTVVKGAAGPPEDAPHKVDGLSGATITSRGVGHTVQFWTDDQGFGPYLQKLHEARS